MSALPPTARPSAEGTETRQLVVFSLAGEQYALPIATVSEIIRHASHGR
jgi:chemotaxis signal transduction protein